MLRKRRHEKVESFPKDARHLGWEGISPGRRHLSPGHHGVPQKGSFVGEWAGWHLNLPYIYIYLECRVGTFFSSNSVFA